MKFQLFQLKESREGKMEGGVQFSFGSGDMGLTTISFTDEATNKHVDRSKNVNRKNIEKLKIVQKNRKSCF